MAVVAKPPRSESAKNSSQPKNQATSLTSSHSSNTSESPVAMRFCPCCPDQHGLQYRFQQQMTTDLLRIGAAFDFDKDHPGRDCTTVLASTSWVGRRKPEESLQATTRLLARAWMPIERWLAEDCKNGPFNAIDSIGATDFILVQDPDNFAFQGITVSDFEDANQMKLGFQERREAIGDQAGFEDRVSEQAFLIDVNIHEL